MRWAHHRGTVVELEPNGVALVLEGHQVLIGLSVRDNLAAAALMHTRRDAEREVEAALALFPEGRRARRSLRTARPSESADSSSAARNPRNRSRMAFHGMHAHAAQEGAAGDMFFGDDH